MTEWLQKNIMEEYNRWPLWIPVSIGVGICTYFLWPSEPDFWMVTGLTAMALLPVFFVKRSQRWLFIILWGVLFGFFCGAYRTESLQTRMLQHERGPLVITGRVDSVDVIPTKSKNPIQRAILSHVHTESKSPLPDKLRITFRGLRQSLNPGDRLEVLVKLMPMAEPSSPWSYDFRRQAYFQGVGGVGFSLGQPTIIPAVDVGGFMGFLNTLRFQMTKDIRAKTPNGSGGVAAALITGDRSGIPEHVREAFINSGLAHILAISGLHLSIIAGLVFLVLRRGLAMVPQISLRWNVKKIAAVLAIGVTWLYLAISGFAIPAERSFYMTILVMLAFLMDRQALSMRSVGIAATLLITTRPEYLISPSFQLSFSAVIGLIAFYESYKNPVGRWLAEGGWWRWLILYMLGLTVTSLIATLATLPFTIFHFNRFTLHAIEANLLAVPLTSFVVMPLALVSTISLLWGGSETLFTLFGWSIELLTGIAGKVSSWPGADIKVATPHIFSVTLFMAGVMWLIVWLRPWRYWGLVPMGVGVVLMIFDRHPDILVDDRLMALHDKNQGVLKLSSTRRGKFTAKQWAGQLGVQSSDKMNCGEGGCLVEDNGYKILMVSAPVGHCPDDVDLIISSEEQPVLDQMCPQKTIDHLTVQQKGSHAIWLTPLLRVQSSRAQRRPWTAVYKKSTYRKGDFKSRKRTPQQRH